MELIKYFITRIIFKQDRTEKYARILNILDYWHVYIYKLSTVAIQLSLLS